MKIELFKKDENDNEIILDSFTLTDLASQQQSEIDFQKKEKERAKKRADKAAADKKKKAANETEGADGEKKEEEVKKEEEPAAPVDDTPIPAPKVKVSVEFSRSGVMLVTKAVVGTHFINIERQRKDIQMSTDALRQAKSRLRWYENRDQDKIKTDMAMNGFESMIYKLREWLRDEDHEPYVESEQRESLIEYCSEMEEWLYDDGSNQNYTTYNKMEKNLTEKYNTFSKRRDEHEKREMILEVVEEGMKDYEAKLEDMKVSKTWITDEERSEVEEKMQEIQKWLREQLEAQNKKQLFEDPVFVTSDVSKKMNALRKFFKRVDGKKKPKPPKKEKIEVVEEEEFADKDEEKKEDNTENTENTENSQEEEKPKEEEAKAEDL